MYTLSPGPCSTWHFSLLYALKGVFIGHLSIGAMIQPGTEGDPDLIAEAWYNLYEKNDHFEEVFPPWLDPITLLGEN